MGTCRALLRQASGGIDEATDLDAISDLIGDSQKILWLDIQDPTQVDIDLLRREFGFHALALEDVSRRRQRPKIERYDDVHFLVFYALQPGHRQEINIFVGPNYLVTIHHGPVPAISETADRWRKNAEEIAAGVGTLVYSLLDTIVDEYAPLVDDLAERVEQLEQELFDGQRHASLAEVFRLKKELLQIRRTVSPERDVLNSLLRRDDPVFGQHTIVYFQDVYDHVLRVIESIDLYRDQLSSLLDANLSLISNRLTIVMKRMTALSTILMSLALIAGIYGMNFKFMPELDWQLGYPFSLFLMVALAASLLYAFKRADWI